MRNKKNNIKPICDKYHPTLYPRTLWVVKNADAKYIDKLFCARNGEGLDLSDISYMCTYEVKHRKTGHYGCLVVIGPDVSKEDLETLVAICAHEAEHVNYTICTDIGLSITYDAQEAAAYLTQWATKCIFHTLRR